MKRYILLILLALGSMSFMRGTEVSIQERNKILADSISQTDSVHYFTEVDEPAYLDITLKEGKKTPHNCLVSIFRYANRQALDLMEEVYPGQCYLMAPLRSKILLYFIIEKDGSLSDIKILSVECDRKKADKEQYEMVKRWAYKILKEMPRLTPAKHKGKVVRVRYFLPIEFQRC